MKLRAQLSPPLVERQSPNDQLLVVELPCPP
jgi:hypothetical protein